MKALSQWGAVLGQDSFQQVVGGEGRSSSSVGAGRIGTTPEQLEVKGLEEAAAARVQLTGSARMVKAPAPPLKPPGLHWTTVELFWPAAPRKNQKQLCLDFFSSSL